jgi:oligoendopeptidase F
MSRKTPTRAEIPVEHTWDTASIFAAPEDWEAAVTQLQAETAKAAQFKGRLAEGPAILAGYLAQADVVYRQMMRIFVYASLTYSVDTNNQEAAARNDRGRGLFGMTMAALAFAQPEMLAIGFDTLRDWQAEDEQLAEYAHYFDQLEKQQAHVRSTEVEQLLGMVRDAFGTAAATHGILANTDLDFPDAIGQDGDNYDITQGTIGALISHVDREVRRTAWENYADAHLTFKNTMANALAAGIKQDVFIMRARGYKSSLEASLNPSFIPVEIFHNLIETFRRNLPTWHRYWRVRRQALGYDKLHEYDIKAPLIANPPKVEYETAVNWITEGMRPLGEEYVAVLKQGATSERWVDIYPNEGKRMGAFSSGVPGTHPFIMMSYNDDLYSLSTLAHELGHSMHSYFTFKTQKLMAYSRYGLFAAEVASNFNQALVRDYLFRTETDPDFQIGLIEEAMSNFHRYFFIMPTLARFELEIHERVEKGQALTADTLIKLMADLFAEGYGDELEMDYERTGITWAQFHTHLYSNFYVYQYATGISAAHALAEDILAGKPGAAENYLKFLQAGGSIYPLDALKLAGVDMTSPEPVESAFAVLAGLVDRLERLAVSR